MYRHRYIMAVMILFYILLYRSFQAPSLARFLNLADSEIQSKNNEFTPTRIRKYEEMPAVKTAVPGTIL